VDMSDLTTLLSKKKSGTTKKIGGRKNTKILENSTKILKNNENINQEQEDNVIIHLPIKLDNVPKNNNLEYSPTIDIPTGYEDMSDIYQHISQKNNPYKNSELIGIGPPPTISMCTYPFDKKNKENNNEDIELDTEINNENLNKNREIASNVCMKDIKKQRDLEIVGRNKLTRSSVEKCLLSMDESNKTKTWPNSIHIHCWWCCHPFDNTPCSIPYEYKNDNYSVYGVFCSPECAASYNFSDTLGISDMWERYSLLNMLYRKVYDNKTYKIKLAPPRQTLKIFGGHLDINEFRENFTNNTHSYKIVMPPMVSIIPVQELSAIDKGFTTKQDKNIMLLKESDNISLDSLNNNTGLRLKRSKPFVATKNTLEKCMNLKLGKEDEKYESDVEENYESV
jgi:hypothetical protein